MDRLIGFLCVAGSERLRDAEQDVSIFRFNGQRLLKFVGCDLIIVFSQSQFAGSNVRVGKVGLRGFRSIVKQLQDFTGIRATLEQVTSQSHATRRIGITPGSLID